jgi:hypothetical protein
VSEIINPFIDWGYYGGDEAGVDDVLASFDFQATPPSILDIDLIVAWYRYEDYSGSAFVVYRDRRDGKIYEVHGGHCSCNGLEGQWEPEEALVVELLRRPHYVWEEDVDARIREALIDNLGGDAHAAAK